MSPKPVTPPDTLTLAAFLETRRADLPSAPTQPPAPPPTPTTALTPRVLAAFFAIYVLWGTTFLAIRFTVAGIPPLLAAGTRFFIAGALLYTALRLRGEPHPTARQWRNLARNAVFLFVITYSLLFWAQRTVPSGVAALLESTIPLFTITLEILAFRRLRFRWSLALAILLGFTGVATLLAPSRAHHLPLVPCLAILVAALSWSVGTLLSQSTDLPSSRPLTAGATMLLGGAITLLLSVAFGELHPLPHPPLRSHLALAYLIVFGSLIAFTAFVWLLARMPATRVASHAYVNPVVAVALGYLIAAEPISPRILFGALLVITSVVLILRKEKAAA